MNASYILFSCIIKLANHNKISNLFQTSSDILRNTLQIKLAYMLYVFGSLTLPDNKSIIQEKAHCMWNIREAVKILVSVINN